MTSINAKFRPSTIAGHEGSIYYQVIHRRQVRQIQSGYKVFADEWDPASATVTEGQRHRSVEILDIRGQMRRDIERLCAIGRRLEAERLAFTADDIVAEYRRDAAEHTLNSFTSAIITRLKEKGKTRTSETYRAALNSFGKFRGGRDIMLDHITPELMEAYEAWLGRRGAVPNTTSFYARILRAIYNRAVDQGIITDRRPFRHVYTGTDHTVKRALPISAIRRIKALDLTDTPILDHARDIFLMSFYLRGMSLIDMAFLRKTDVIGRRVCYRRRKTGRLLTIGWTPEMQAVIDKYPPNPTPYLLPIIRAQHKNTYTAYRNAGYNINRALKQIALMAGIKITLTLYVARHSWASAAKTKGIPVSVISEGMGHNSETTTQIYLTSLDTTVIDRANTKIISSI